MSILTVDSSVKQVLKSLSPVTESGTVEHITVILRCTGGELRILADSCRGNGLKLVYVEKGDNKEN